MWVSGWLDGSSRCKGPETDACLVLSGSSREASLAKVGGEEERIVEDELREDEEIDHVGYCKPL